MAEYLSSLDVEKFHRDGFLVLRNLLDIAEDLEPVIDEYERKLEELVTCWHAQGQLSSTFADLPIAQRVALILTEMGRPAYQALDISLPFSNITEATPIHLGPNVFRLLTNSRLIDAVEKIVGTEIMSNPIQHVRIKPPERLLPEGGSPLVGKTDWHQDQAVCLPEADETEMVTVWLPITDATEENGCLCVMLGSHKKGLVTHYATPSGPRIPSEHLSSDWIPLPVRKGDAIFLHRRTMHSSLRNLSDSARWSFDLRFQPVGQPTGRPSFPSFVVRSRQDPSSELHDADEWALLWLQTRTYLAAHPPQSKFSRWTGEGAGY